MLQMAAGIINLYSNSDASPLPTHRRSCCARRKQDSCPTYTPHVRLSRCEKRKKKFRDAAAMICTVNISRTRDWLLRSDGGEEAVKEEEKKKKA